MISNITNTLVSMLKNIKDEKKDSKLEYNIFQFLKFYKSIITNEKDNAGLRHIYLDICFTIKSQLKNILEECQIGLNTISFLKDFDYIIDNDNGILTIRSNLQNLAIFSLIMIGSIKNLRPQEKNNSIFNILVLYFLKYCKNNNYNVCKDEDITLLEQYNNKYQDKIISDIVITPTLQDFIATFHFIGIQLNYDILKIFQDYKDVKFSYNPQTASYIITMKSQYWDDFWQKAPEYLKKELQRIK